MSIDLQSGRIQEEKCLTKSQSFALLRSRKSKILFLIASERKRDEKSFEWRIMFEKEKI